MTFPSESLGEYLQAEIVGWHRVEAHGRYELRASGQRRLGDDVKESLPMGSSSSGEILPG